MPLPIDLTGRKFGRLTVDRFIGSRRVGSQSKRFWACTCDCGATTELPGGALTQGNTLSCGCLLREVITKHGECKTAVYKVWHAMICRCERTTNSSFKDYGGRGIRVHPAWHDFSTFIADMGDRPEGASLDRINNDGHYEPGNCRWATSLDQANNRRTNRILELNGERHTVAEWAKKLSISRGTVLHRLNAGWPLERVLAGHVP